MALGKFGTNLIFACLVALLGLTAVTSIFIKANQPGIRQTESAQEPSGSQMPANHPSVEAAGKLADLEQLIIKEPQNPDHRTQIGNLYYDMGQYDKAADFYQQSLGIRPRDPNVETDLATCFYYLGQSDKALEILDKVLEYSPGFPMAMLNKGVVLVDGKRDIKGGIAVWENLLRSNPSFPQKAELEQRISQLKASAK